MKQILQNLRDGTTMLADVPAPSAGRGQLLIRTHRSLVSAGTERMIVDFGKAGLIDKARQQPDKVRMVVDKIRSDGFLPTLEAIQNKLDQPLRMGYCNVGSIIGIGPGVSGFRLGDRVVSNGFHAEIVAVPVNLCAKVPDSVSDDAAAFTVLASIGLQGIRLLQPSLGECIVVTGLGLIGLVTVQLLRASGCRVLGLDFDPARLEMARTFGAEVVNLGEVTDPCAAALEFSRGRGVDGVIVTAATRSNEPVHQAAVMCRKRGRIVLVGIAGLELSRADFYEKELTFQVSCSYGPGRYDPKYEQGGNDYPVGYVRWTEQRNFEATLDMLADGRIVVNRLVSHRFKLADAHSAYAVVAGAEPSLGILLEYGEDEAEVAKILSRTVDVSPGEVAQSPVEAVGVSIIGAGNYAGAVLIPAFRDAGASFRFIAGAGGPGGVHLGRKFRFLKATTDVAQLLVDDKSRVIVIATRHDTHAKYVMSALEAGKHVFVEKPLCLTRNDLDVISDLAEQRQECILMVGFNRRFSPLVQQIKTLLASRPGPKSFLMTVNAGVVPADHWTQDAEVGGGRVVGEACHFLDLLRYLADARISDLAVRVMRDRMPDSVNIQLAFSDGSIGTIHYLANGSRAFPKERLEVFASGGVLQLDNFRRLRGFGWKRFSSMSLWRQDKGQKACAAAFLTAVAHGQPSPIPLPELLEVSEASIYAQGLAK